MVTIRLTTTNHILLLINSSRAYIEL